jgi:hypothetical protein
MRFAIVALALAAVVAASPDGYDYHKKCECPKDKYHDKGVHINQGKYTYQCAYPKGACEWKFVSKQNMHRWGILIQTIGFHSIGWRTRQQAPEELLGVLALPLLSS